MLPGQGLVLNFFAPTGPLKRRCDADVDQTFPFGPINGQLTARELVQHCTNDGERTMLDLLAKAEGEMPSEPNAYTDVSMPNPKGWNWQIGGFGHLVEKQKHPEQSAE